MFPAMWWRGWVYPWPGDKILAGDAKFGAILRVPVLFFTQPMPYFDQLARTRSGWISARMALARLEASAGFPPPTASGIVQFWCSISTGSTVHALPGRAGVCRGIPLSLPL